MLTKLLTAGAVLLSLTGTAQAQQYYYYPTAPVYAAPQPQVVYSAPTYYSQPVYAAPVYAQPTYVQPTYVQPVYAQPYPTYYGGYYSPLSIGLNFGFGGGRHWR